MHQVCAGGAGTAGGLITAETKLARPKLCATDLILRAQAPCQPAAETQPVTSLPGGLAAGCSPSLTPSCALTLRSTAKLACRCRKPAMLRFGNLQCPPLSKLVTAIVTRAGQLHSQQVVCTEHVSQSRPAYPPAPLLEGPRELAPWTAPFAGAHAAPPEARDRPDSSCLHGAVANSLRLKVSPLHWLSVNSNSIGATLDRLHPGTTDPGKGIWSHS